MNQSYYPGTEAVSPQDRDLDKDYETKFRTTSFDKTGAFGGFDLGKLAEINKSQMQNALGQYNQNFGRTDYNRGFKNNQFQAASSDLKIKQQYSHPNRKDSYKRI